MKLVSADSLLCGLLGTERRCLASRGRFTTAELASCRSEFSDLTFSLFISLSFFCPPESELDPKSGCRFRSGTYSRNPFVTPFADFSDFQP